MDLHFAFMKVGRDTPYKQFFYSEMEDTAIGEKRNKELLIKALQGNDIKIGDWSDFGQPGDYIKIERV